MQFRSNGIQYHRCQGLIVDLEPLGLKEGVSVAFEKLFCARNLGSWKKWRSMPANLETCEREPDLNRNLIF